MTRHMIAAALLFSHLGLSGVCFAATPMNVDPQEPGPMSLEQRACPAHDGFHPEIAEHVSAGEGSACADGHCFTVPRDDSADFALPFLISAADLPTPSPTAAVPVIASSDEPTDVPDPPPILAVLTIVLRE